MGEGCRWRMCGEGEEVWVRGVCRWRMCGECEEVWVRGVGERCE